MIHSFNPHIPPPPMVNIAHTSTQTTPQLSGVTIHACLPKPVSGISGADGRIKGITWEDFNIMIHIANKKYTNWNIGYMDRQN